MSAVFYLDIISFTRRGIFCVIFASFLMSNLVRSSSGLRLNNMSVPAIAELFEPMALNCEFDMGSEELYAVKWYKDEHEFFRYIPGQVPQTFPVAGVHVENDSTDCGHDRCKILLSKLSKDHSGGKYRCEISSEAPAFRLVAETRNVIIAALPAYKPRIEGLIESYAVGDFLNARCVAAPSDPAPILAWFINNKQSSISSTETTTSEPDRKGLVTRTVSLRLEIERKHSLGNSLELRCVSSLPGIPLEPQITAKLVNLKGNQPQVNNQKLHWLDSSAEVLAADALLLAVLAARQLI